ncbi:MAG: hypothetical protein GX868_11485 [Actinobacteria bacterium]|nr:hypothetical protein [Actinomycetota bacterium]
MRLVRFEDESGGFAVDFHPLITVISGLPAHIRERLTRAVAAIPSGGDPGGRGVLEVHGVQLDLTRDTLELLELNESLDIIVRPEDLPGSSAVAHLLSDRFAEAAVGGAAVDAAAAAVEGLRVEYAEALGALESYRVKVAALSAEFDQLEADRAATLASLDHRAAPDLDDASNATEYEVDAPITGRPTGRPSGTPGDASGDASSEQLAAEIADLEVRLSDAIERSNELKRQLRTLHALDPEPVRAAFDSLAPLVLETDGSGPAAAAGEAEQLRSRTIAAIDDVLGRWQRHVEAAPPAAAGPEIDPRDLERLRAERERSLHTLEEIRAELDCHDLDPALVAELERTHDQIFEMDGKAPRFGAAKHHRLLEELRAEEAELLEKLGFDTWSTYVMGMSSVEVRTEADYETAYRTFEEIDRELDEATRRHEAQRSAAAAVARHAAELGELVRRSVELIDDDEFAGTGDAEIVDALLARRARLAVPRPAKQDPVAAVSIPPEALATAEQNLRWALDHAGVELPTQELSAAQLCSLAGGWLDAMSELPHRIAEVSAERAEHERVIERLGARYETLVATLDDLAAASDATEAADATDAVNAGDAVGPATAEGRPATDRSADPSTGGALEAIEAKNARLEQRSADLQFSLREREHRVAQVMERLNAAELHLRQCEATNAEVPRIAQNLSDVASVSDRDTIESVEWYVLARLAQQRAVSFVGSVPVVFDNAFVTWSFADLREVFERLRRMAEVIQIIVLTDDPSIVEWARGIGESRAKVIDSFVLAP